MFGFSGDTGILFLIDRLVVFNWALMVRIARSATLLFFSNEDHVLIGKILYSVNCHIPEILTLKYGHLTFIFFDFVA